MAAGRADSSDGISSGGIDADLGADLAACALALARTFANGGTMWCVAPSWPEHARHVAVEFVHPVIVGKRALPAVSIGGAGVVSTLRAAVRPGDVLLAIAPADSAEVAESTRRAPAWGVTSVWVGAGPRPGAGAADHVLWLDDGDAAAHVGRLVLLYHVLWELTHVCFEHPGLLSNDAGACDVDGHCITCADEGRLGEVDAVLGADAAQVRTARGIEVIDTTVVGPLRRCDLVVVLGGSAITVLAEAAS
jgi:hypothetical protein